MQVEPELCPQFAETEALREEKKINLPKVTQPARGQAKNQDSNILPSEASSDAPLNGGICLSLQIPRPQPGLAGSQGFPGHREASHWLMDSALGQSGEP